MVGRTSWPATCRLQLWYSELTIGRCFSLSGGEKEYHSHYHGGNGRDDEKSPGAGDRSSWACWTGRHVKDEVGSRIIVNSPVAGCVVGGNVVCDTSPSRLSRDRGLGKAAGRIVNGWKHDVDSCPVICGVDDADVVDSMSISNYH